MYEPTSAEWLTLAAWITLVLLSSGATVFGLYSLAYGRRQGALSYVVIGLCLLTLGSAGMGLIWWSSSSALAPLEKSAPYG
jgi:heme/copper-type cytochrome/quinol oxidase subunit 3